LSLDKSYYIVYNADSEVKDMATMEMITKVQYLEQVQLLQDEIIDEEELKPEHALFQRVRQLKKEKILSQIARKRKQMETAVVTTRWMNKTAPSSFSALLRRRKAQKKMIILHTQLKILTASLLDIQREIYQQAEKRNRVSSSPLFF